MSDWRNILNQFERTKVLLIGDTILDIYTYGEALGLSAETPTIVARKGEVKVTLGGAALVCRNLLELGASVQFITLVGEDEEAAHVRSFENPKLKLVPMVEPGRRTTVKHRFWVDGYKLFQLDTRDDRVITSATAAKVLAEVAGQLPDTDTVILSDYRHGLLSPELVASLLELLRRAGKPVFVDSQVAQNASNHRLYHGDSVICLNLKEAHCLDPQFAPATAPEAFSTLQKELKTGSIVVKLGDKGSMMFKGGRVVHVPAEKVKACDTTGAGDAFLAALCLAGIDNPEQALKVANRWAGLSVQIHGTAPPNKQDLLRAAG